MNYSVAGNGRRERLKIMQIGQSAALIPDRRHVAQREESLSQDQGENMITKDKLIDLYVTENKTQTEIGAMLGCDRKNVDYYIKKYGIPKKSKVESAKHLRRTDLTPNDVLRMVENGMLVQDICKQYGVGRGPIYKITRRVGINLRNHFAQTKRQSDSMRSMNPFFNDQTKAKAIENSRIHKMENYREKHSKFIEMDFREYSKIARYLARCNYGRAVPCGCEIDHIYSVFDGFTNKVPLTVLSHSFNLRLVSRMENKTKNKMSLISLQELYEGVGVQRLSCKGVAPSGAKSGAQKGGKAPLFCEDIVWPRVKAREDVGLRPAP